MNICSRMFPLNCSVFLGLHEDKAWLDPSPPIFLPRFKFIWLIRWSTAVCSINYVLSCWPCYLKSHILKSKYDYLGIEACFIGWIAKFLKWDFLKKKKDEIDKVKTKRGVGLSNSFFMASSAWWHPAFSNPLIPTQSHFSEQLCQDFIQERLYATRPFQTSHLNHLH